MKISVLLAVYNGEKYLSKSIESVLKQSYKNIELLIGFNGTTDNSKEIVRSYEDPRIRIFDYGEDKGKAKTLNKLIKEASGSLLAIQDDDDIWLENKLANQVAFFDRYDVVGSQISYINNEGEISGKVKLSVDHEEIKRKSLNGDNQIANTSAVFKRVCVDEIGGWRTNLDGIEDFDFWLRLLRKGFKFHNLSSIEVLHRLHSKSNFNTKHHDLSLILKTEERTPEVKEKLWRKIMKSFKL